MFALRGPLDYLGGGQDLQIHAFQYRQDMSAQKSCTYIDLSLVCPVCQGCLAVT